MFELQCFFRSQGVQWPLRAGDTCWLRRRGGGDETKIPAEVVINLTVLYQSYGLRFQEQRRSSLPARKPLAAINRGPIHVVPIEVQEARRAKRRRKA